MNENHEIENDNNDNDSDFESTDMSPTKSNNEESSAPPASSSSMTASASTSASSYHKSLSIDVGDNGNDAAAGGGGGATAEVIPPNLSIYPSLRGRLFRDTTNNTIKCVGEWAMTDSAHGIPGQTSEFEFRLQQGSSSNHNNNSNNSTDSNNSTFPISGKYIGWFHLKQPMKAPLKVEDKELNIVFQKSSASGGGGAGAGDNKDDYIITGHGINKFGKFSLYGTFNSLTGKLQMYRVYIPKKAIQTPKSTKGIKTPNFTSPRQGRTPSSTSHSHNQNQITPSPRETGQRVRKPSAALTGSFEASITTPTSGTKRHNVEITDSLPSSTTTVTSSTAAGAAAASTTGAVVSSSGRSTRPSPHLTKCKDILKDLSKQPLSIYFNDPVDPIKLNIPDYFTIIKEPMDFSTIRKNFENQIYLTHEQYAEHMRLVFRNAIAYNVRRDNPVHIAARELSDMFEERYRVMVSQLTAAYSVNYEEPIPPPPKKTAGRSRGSKSYGGRTSSGPRDFALDGSAQAMRMMQQKMLEMEAEINSLRTAVRQSDIRATLGHQMVAAQAPLTYEEKKILTNNINKLDGDHMAAVVDIIQSVMPSACSDGEDIEIPVDELDTYTLRQLQDFVQNALAAKSKKRSVPPSPGPKTPTSRSNNNPPKKSRTTSSSTTTAATAAAAAAPPPPSVVTPSPTAMIPPPSNTSFTNTTNTTQSIISSSTPTFFSNQSYVPLESSDFTSTRKRSNSLDFFPADDITAPDDLLQNPDAWGGLISDQLLKTETGNNGWGDALIEKHVSETRKITLQAEAEKSKELRSKHEEERSAALALERQKSLNLSDSEIQRRTKELELLREQERLSREGLEPTVELGNAHSALYNHSTLYEL